MKKVLQRLILSGLTVFCLTASDCGTSSQPVIPPIDAEVQIDGSQDGGQVFILHGQVLVLSLDANPSTGFTWDVEQLDTSILRQVGLPEFQAGSSALGAGGTQTFRFQTLTSGETDLRLIYHRPFEEGVEPLDRFAVHVIVL